MATATKKLSARWNAYSLQVCPVIWNVELGRCTKVVNISPKPKIRHVAKGSWANNRTLPLIESLLKKNKSVLEYPWFDTVGLGSYAIVGGT